MTSGATFDLPKVYGIVAEFDDPDIILAAAHRAREAGYTRMNAYTPFPVHGIDDAIQFRDTKVQWTIGIAGVLGCIGGMSLQYYTSAVAYPMNVGGRPKFSWPSFIPVAFESTILFAGLAAVVGMLAFNGLPKPYHPIFNTPNFEQASQTRFFLCIEADDPKFDSVDTSRFLEGLQALQVSTVNADDGDKY